MAWGLVLALGCASPPGEKVDVHPGRAAAEAAIEFPPTGPVELRPRPSPPEGTLYQLVVSYDGRTEVMDEQRQTIDPESVNDKFSIEIDYRQLPVAAPPEGGVASTLVLEALKRRERLTPPGKEHVLEIGDDRLRTTLDDKVDTDLRGAQPKQDLTPRMVLEKPFALVVADSRNDPKGVTIRGLPAARKLLASLPLRETISYLQIARPDRPVTAGDSWHAKRFVPNPIGKLGLALDLEVRLVGFERVGAVPCARLAMRTRSETTDVPSEMGFHFNEVRYNVQGDAWIDLANGEVVEAHIEDVSAVSYHRTSGSRPALLRMRYEGHSSLQRLDALPEVHWADGTKRFSAVK
ncbi:MAG TPA: hypothetical protein VMR86_01310 [Myxococcota bacterium]|nr:hypothetical protein [Myxococcota bacterium]